MNRAILFGRLTKDVDLRTTPNGRSVAMLTLAIDRPVTKDGNKEADFIPVVLWGKTAEAVARYVHKGQRLLVEGRIQVRSYDGKDGQKRYATEVVADKAEFIDKSEQGASQQDSGFGQQNSGFETTEVFGQPVRGGDCDIPF